MYINSHWLLQKNTLIYLAIVEKNSSWPRQSTPTCLTVIPTWVQGLKIMHFEKFQLWIGLLFLQTIPAGEKNVTLPKFRTCLVTTCVEGSGSSLLWSKDVIIGREWPYHWVQKHCSNCYQKVVHRSITHIWKVLICACSV